MAFDEELKQALDSVLLSWPNVSSRKMFGQVGYMVEGQMFAALSDGVVGAKLPDDLRQQAFQPAGVSPFRPTGRPFGSWVQFVMLLADDVSAVIPWLEAASQYVASEPAPKKRRRKVSR